MLSSSISFGSAPVVPQRNVTARLEQAILHAETSSLHLQVAHEATKDSYTALDGYQPAAVDISRDNALRDVSASGRELVGKAKASTTPAEAASSKQYAALQTLDWASSALEQAIPDLSPADQKEALRAHRQLYQREALWQADVALGTALATVNGGALPYIEIAAGDGPGQDVSWTGGEIYGNLGDALGQLGQAGQINGRSLHDVNGALAILRDLHERQFQPKAH